MDLIKTLREQALDRLSVTEGKELDLTCNLTSSRQMEVIIESEAHNMIGSQYVKKRDERLLRLTCGFGARHRQDIVEVTRSSKDMGGGDL